MVALYLLYACGWFHGDISPGNILVYGDFVKMADLEYAKYKDEVDEHDGSVRLLYDVHLGIASLDHAI